MTRGFANGMDPEAQRAIAREGGRIAHALGLAHEFTEDEAREAGKKGGAATSRDRKYMAEIGRRGGRRSTQQEEAMIETERAVEANSNPSTEEGEDQPTRARSQPALPSKYDAAGPRQISWEDLAKLVGVSEASRIYGLYEAATTYHPTPTSIAAALACLRGINWPTHQLMQQAGPALVTWLRKASMGKRTNGRSADAFRFYIRSHYPNDYQENLVTRRHTRTDPRVAAQLRAEGKKRCPYCAEIKPLAAFTSGKGKVQVYCAPCRLLEAKEKRDRNRAEKDFIATTLPEMPTEELTMKENANGN